MKKIIFALLFATVLISPSLKGMDIDPFCIKNQGSIILDDQKWHTLTFKTYGYYDRHMSDILIRQKKTYAGCDDYAGHEEYEFKDTSKKIMFEFYDWLYQTCDSLISRTISMEKDPNGGYIGEFQGNIVPSLDHNPYFIGIDIFK